MKPRYHLPTRSDLSSELVAALAAITILVAYVAWQMLEAGHLIRFLLAGSAFVYAAWMTFEAACTASLIMDVEFDAEDDQAEPPT